MKNTFVAALILMLTGIVSLARPEPQPARSLSLIALPELTEYKEGEPLPFSLTFKNTGNKRTSFFLPHKDEDPPGFIRARVWDAEDGKLLTLNNTLKDGWWTKWMLSGDFYIEKQADRVSLKPDEEYTLTLDLKRLLSGCRCLPEGLRSGVYRVQFSFYEVISNQVEIRIGSPEDV